MVEKRTFERLAVTLSGTLFVHGFDIPITINNLSVPVGTNSINEIGIGFQCHNDAIPKENLMKIGTHVRIQFIDSDYIDNVQLFKFEISHINPQKCVTVFGARLRDSDINYPLYVQAKKRLVIAREADQLEEFLDNL